MIKKKCEPQIQTKDDIFSALSANTMEIAKLMKKMSEEMVDNVERKYNYAAAQRSRVSSFELAKLLKTYRKLSLDFQKHKEQPVELAVVTNKKKAKCGKSKCSK